MHLFAALEPATNRLARTVNPSVYAQGEIDKRLRNGNSFVRRVMAQSKIWVIGEDVASPLENLTGPGEPLKKETPDAKELSGLKRSALARLTGASKSANLLESRFDLAYNGFAGHFPGRVGIC